MANGKSTWRYNKLLTPRRRYYDIGGILSGWSQQGLLNSNFTQDWWNTLSMPDKVAVEDWIENSYNGFENAPDFMYTAMGTTRPNLSHGYTPPANTPVPNPVPNPNINNPLFQGREPVIDTGAPVTDGPTIVEDESIINNDSDKVSNVSNFGSGIAGLAGAAATDIGTMINNINSNDITARKKQLIGGINKAQLKNVRNDSFDQLMSDYSSTNSLGHVTAKDLGAKSAGTVFGESLVAGLRGSAAGFGFGSSLAYGGPKRTVNKYMGGGPIGAIIGGVMGTGTSLIGNLIRNHKAGVAAAEVEDARNYTEAFNSRHFNNRAVNLANDQFNFLESNYGMTPNYGAYGGELHTQGGNFTNGIISINNGGSHESNPYEGVPMGVDPEGTPNLVEEGETVFNDYVFSKRMTVPKGIRRKYKFGGTKNVSFADFSKFLAKESEERPNDPISKRGLIAVMQDLAQAQEQKRILSNSGNSFSTGGRMGNLYAGEGAGNQTLNYNNSTPNLYFGLSPEVFNPYNSNNSINWDIMYGADSPYTKRRKYVLDNWDSEGVQAWLDRYVEGINSYNSGRAGYTPMTKADITRDIFSKRTWDKHWGGMHAGIDYAGDPEEKLVTEHLLKNADGSTTKLPESDWYYPNINFETGDTWDNTVGKRIQRLNNGNYVESFDPVKHVRTRRYFYSPLEAKKTPKDRYFGMVNGKYKLIEEENAPLWLKNNNYFLHDTVKNPDGSGGNDFYYNLDDPLPEQGKYADWLRYAPALGFGLASLSDAFGWTNKPDYSNADAILEATSKPGQYQPVSFNPIGNYLTYKPFDRDYYINKQNSESGATRRNVLNTSGGNRATAMAGVLAADNNYLNGIGALARQAEEFNFNTRKEVEDFNRTTNITNSQGKLQADIANQSALASLREYQLKGNLEAYKMREAARLASDTAKSANITGLFQTLGDIGFEERNAWMRDLAIRHGVVGPGTYDYGRFKTSKDKSKDKSKGKSNNNKTNTKTEV